MRIPKFFYIRNKRWKVIRKPLDDLDGYCDGSTRTICIDSSLRGKALKSCFFHEWFHAVVYSYNLHVTSLTPDVEEILCEAVGESLTDKPFKL